MSATKTETRRKAARAKIGSEIAYLNFDSGNGAIVVDVSSEGLGFQAADRVPENAPVSFRLCTSDLPNIDLAGEIAWLDETHKRGGLRLRVPANSRAAFDKWLHKHFGSLAEDETADASPSPAPAIDPPNPSAPNANPGPERPAPIPNFTPRPAAHSGGRGPIFVSEWELPPEESHTGRNVLVVCVILVLGLAIAGSYYFGGRRQFGAMLIRLGQSLVGTSSQAPLRTLNATNANALPPAQSNSQPQLPVAPSSTVAPQSSPAGPAAPATSAAPAAAAQDSSVNTRGAGSSASNATPTAASQAQPPTVPPAATAETPAGATNAASTVARPAPPTGPGTQASTAETPSPTSQPPAAAVDYGQPEVTQARKLLADSNPQDSSVAADLLWSAVSKGNTTAEMMLADIYLEGHGAVRQNCRQAEALLTAAQSGNVPGAEQKLEELQTYGCR